MFHSFYRESKDKKASECNEKEKNPRDMLAESKADGLINSFKCNAWPKWVMLFPSIVLPSVHSPFC